MADPVRSPAPKIDDAYWFSVSEDLVSKSMTRHEDAAAKLQNLVLWLWGIYTTYAAVGTTLAGKSIALWAVLLIGLASAALIAVYWGTVWVQAPVRVSFDPRSPDDIRSAFGRILETKQKRFAATMAGSIVAAFLVAVALMIASSAKEDKHATPSLTGSIVEVAGSRQLAIVATVGKGSQALLRVEPIPHNQAVAKTEHVVLATEGGLVQANVRLDRAVKMARVTIEWKDRNGMKWAITQDIPAGITQSKGGNASG
jgi:hypothetical protein